MGKIKTLIITLCIFFFSITTVSAVCNVEETNRLNSLAVNIKNSYEIITKEIPAEDNFNAPDGLTEEEIKNYKYYRDYFKIYINNVTEDLYVKVTNKNTNEVKTYYYSDSDNGTISFEEKVSYYITNYVIEIYSSDKTNCKDTKLYTHYLTTPKYNSLSESILCEEIENYYLCNEYLSVEVSFENYEDKINAYREGKVNEIGEELDEEVGNNEQTLSFIKEYRIPIIILVVGVAISSLVIVIIKKQRSKKI